MVVDRHHRPPFFHSLQQQEGLVDPEIWRTIAGTSVRIPAVNSLVYYFPQGHINQASSTVSLSSLVASKPLIPCRVLQVLYLADKNSDEVFAKIFLEPLGAPFVSEHASSQNNGGEDGHAVSSFTKVLTSSDANNGGGFSVPRSGAESIFPKLDFDADPPVQTLHITDVHGETWDFRHIYRGTPRRHLITTNWSNFVNSKKMIAGDSVVFMNKGPNKDLYVGIRRAVKSKDTSNWAQRYANNVNNAPVVSIAGSFSRDGKGKVPPEVVLESAELAANNLPFEVVYYPRAGSPDFVVAAEKVNEGINTYWSAGMRVKMAVETEDSSKITMYQGTVASVVCAGKGDYWRMLDVAWDEPTVVQLMKRVSPWQVEVVETMPPAKRFRLLPITTSLLTDDDGEGNIPLPRFESNSVVWPFRTSFLNYNYFPAGMQGARQNPFYGFNLPNIVNSNSDAPQNQREDAVSTNLDITSSSSNAPSPDSQNNIQFFGASSSSQQLCNSPRKSHGKTVKVFGTVLSTGYDDCATHKSEEDSQTFLD